MAICGQTRTPLCASYIEASNTEIEASNNERIPAQGRYVMKQRMKELGDAINQTLANSDQIADVISRIKDEGYDVFLVLEATVGFNKRDAQAVRAGNAPDEIQAGVHAELRVNAQDLRFLKSLRITVDSDADAA